MNCCTFDHSLENKKEKVRITKLGDCQKEEKKSLEDANVLVNQIGDIGAQLVKDIRKSVEVALYLFGHLLVFELFDVPSKKPLSCVYSKQFDKGRELSILAELFRCLRPSRSIILHVHTYEPLQRFSGSVHQFFSLTSRFRKRDNLRG